MPVTSDQRLTTPSAGRPVRNAIGMILLRKLRLMRQAEAGVAALEFGLFAPILFLSLLAMVDLGFALNERMTIDHVLRAGAQTAMDGGNEAAVYDVLEATASKNFTGDQTLALAVDRYCACGDKPTQAVGCSTTCTGPTETSIFLRLTGTKTYEGMLLPPMNLAPSVEVQLR